MSVWVMSICFNEANIIPFYLRHYSSFADRIFVWDDNSTDGSRELLESNKKVTLDTWPYDDGMSENDFLNFAHRTYPEACGKADWVIWVDMDEFIYHPDIASVLVEGIEKGWEVIRTTGYNMTGDGLPKDDGRQIWELSPMGVVAHVYSKPVVFRPCSRIQWIRGKHMLENCNPVMSPEPMLKLLHYRFLGYEYAKARSAKNYSRFSIRHGDKGAAWGVHPDYKGEGSPDYAREAAKVAFKVI